MIEILPWWVRAVRQVSCWMIAALAGLWLAAPAAAQEVEDLLTPRKAAPHACWRSTFAERVSPGFDDGL